VLPVCETAAVSFAAPVPAAKNASAPGLTTTAGTPLGAAVGAAVAAAVGAAVAAAVGVAVADPVGVPVGAVVGGTVGFVAGVADGAGVDVPMAATVGAGPEEPPPPPQATSRAAPMPAKTKIERNPGLTRVGSPHCVCFTSHDYDVAV
jgi:hypothetical protein